MQTLSTDMRENGVAHLPEPMTPLDVPPVNRRYQPWGRYPASTPRKVIPLQWASDPLPLNEAEGTVLPYGVGRSYGDSCLNNGQTLLDVRPLRRFLAFDATQGILRCEAGVLLAEILELVVPHGWFLPVTPGTKFVTIGGAIANDVHGKNHHVAGTFGCHVTQFELLRSDGVRYLCSPNDNNELFRATIGGLGLTGLITWAEFHLQAIPGPNIDREDIQFNSVEEFFELSAASNTDYKYIVSWIDCLASGKNLGRGIFTRGNFAWQKHIPQGLDLTRAQVPMPVELPSFALNRFSVQAFNQLYYRKQITKVKRSVTHYNGFFYPLDAILDWNRMYGPKGFLQYQCLVPNSGDHDPIKTILETIAASGQGSFLAVLKTCGDIASPGMLSFPRPGVTLALDFMMRGASTLQLCERLDEIVRESGGTVYIAKDARMSSLSFQTYYPQWREFAYYIDPAFSSSFWRRVTSAL